MFGLSRLTPIQFAVLLVIGLLVFGAPILQLWNNPAFLVALLFGLVVGITVHEASHATVAVLLGDPTPRMMGRVSLNPLRHLDLLGSIAMLIASFGWGKPVQFNPYRLRTDPRLGSAVVAAAGPVSNILVAIVGALILKMIGWHFTEPGHQVLTAVIFINVGLAAFNLLPIPPLDGYNLVVNLLPKSIAQALAPLETYGPLILLALIFLGPMVFRFDVLGSMLRPIRTVIIAMIQAVVGRI
jgi:Zn-dependent protease